jgi:hypothetical protein
MFSRGIVVLRGFIVRLEEQMKRKSSKILFNRRAMLLCRKGTYVIIIINTTDVLFDGKLFLVLG